MVTPLARWCAQSVRERAVCGRARPCASRARRRTRYDGIQRRSPRAGLALLAAAWLMLALVPAPLHAQSLDDLFATPDATDADDATSTGDASDGDAADSDTTDSADETDAGPPIDLSALTTSPTRVSGSVSARAGFSVGLLEWPGTPAADELRRVENTELLSFAGLYGTTVNMTVDSRPAPYLRFNATLTSSLQPSSMRFASPSISSMFIDYTFADTLFVRAGQFGMGWGRARLFSSPANLVSAVSSGAAIRASLPTARGSLTAVTWANSASVAKYDAFNPRAFSVAGQWESTFGGLTAEAGGFFRVDAPIAGALSLTTSVGGVTVSAEGVYRTERTDPWSQSDTWAAIGNAFWENSDRTFSIWGEYRYDSNPAAASDGSRQLAGLAMQFPGVSRRGGWRPAISWKHAIEDTSGEVVAGISGTVAPQLSLSVGVPVIYGQPGSYYRAAVAAAAADIDGEDASSDLDPLAGDDTVLVPIDNVVMLLLTVSLSFSF